MSRKKPHQKELDKSNSGAFSSSHLNMSYNGKMVDLNGKLVGSFKAPDGEVYVSLKDMEKCGFRAFEKKYFEKATDLDKNVRRDIKEKLFNYGLKCILEANKIFTERDISDMFERVFDQVLGDESEPIASLAQNRPISGQQTFETNTVSSVGSSSRDGRQTSATGEKPVNTFAKVERPEQESPNTQIPYVSETENIRQVERVKLEKGSFELKVTYLLSDKPIFYAQLLQNFNIVEEILLHVNSIDLFLPVIENPKKDMLVVAEFEEVWYRGVVVAERGLTSDSTIVEFLDYGNQEEIKGDIRQMSEEMQKIPAQAMRFSTNVYSTLNVSKLEIDQDIEVDVKQLENNKTTYLVDIKRILGFDGEMDMPLDGNHPLENVKPAPKAAPKCFMQIQKQNAEIRPGELLFIAKHTEDKLIVKNKETSMLSKKISSVVASIQKEPITDPKVGQYVLYNSVDFEEQFFRAIIKEIHGELAWLQQIDFPEVEETHPLTSLKNIDEDLASIPPAHIEINYPPLEKVTNKGLALLSKLIESKLKIKSTLVDGLIDFIVDGELLSTTLTCGPTKSDAIPSSNQGKPAVTKNVESVRAESVVTESKNKEFEKIFFRDMPFIEPEVGLNLYLCYSCHGGSLTIIFGSDENIELLNKVTVDKPENNEPYKPVQYEMCLVKYDDGSWCRAMALGNNDGKVEVTFVDYGGLAKVAVEDVRKLPEEMKTIPILGINADIDGIEISDVVGKRLIEAIQDGEVLEVDVKVGKKIQNCMNYYSVELPSVYNILKNEGLII